MGIFFKRGYSYPIHTARWSFFLNPAPCGFQTWDRGNFFNSQVHKPHPQIAQITQIFTRSEALPRNVFVRLCLMYSQMKWENPIPPTSLLTEWILDLPLSLEISEPFAHFPTPLFLRGWIDYIFFFITSFSNISRSFQIPTSFPQKMWRKSNSKLAKPPYFLTPVSLTYWYYNIFQFQKCRESILQLANFRLSPTFDIRALINEKSYSITTFNYRFFKKRKFGFQVNFAKCRESLSMNTKFVVSPHFQTVQLYQNLQWNLNIMLWFYLTYSHFSAFLHLY